MSQYTCYFGDSCCDKSEFYQCMTCSYTYCKRHIRHPHEKRCQICKNPTGSSTNDRCKYHGNRVMFK